MGPDPVNASRVSSAGSGGQGRWDQERAEIFPPPASPPRPALIAPSPQPTLCLCALALARYMGSIVITNYITRIFRAAGELFDLDVHFLAVILRGTGVSLNG